MDTDLINLLVGLAMALGLAGTILPVLPGLAVMWLSAVVFGFASGWGPVGITAIVAITGIVVYANWRSLRIPQKSVSDHGIGLLSQVVALVGAVLGFFVIPLVGAVLGFVAAVFLGRLVATRSVNSALTATSVALRAMFVVAVNQFAAGVLVFGIWLIWIQLV